MFDDNWGFEYTWLIEGVELHISMSWYNFFLFLFLRRTNLFTSMLDLKTADDIAFYFFYGCSRIFFISNHFIVFNLLLKGMGAGYDVTAAV